MTHKLLVSTDLRTQSLKTKKIFWKQLFIVMFINGLHRKSNEKCGFIAAPTDVHFVLMCHIMAKNDQFLRDQGRIFQNIDECSEKWS